MLFAHNHHIIKDEYCSSMSMAEVWTFIQIQDFIDIELQNKMTLRGSKFLKGGRERGGGRKRERVKIPNINTLWVNYLGE